MESFEEDRHAKTVQELKELHIGIRLDHSSFDAVLHRFSLYWTDIAIFRQTDTEIEVGSQKFLNAAD